MERSLRYTISGEALIGAGNTFNINLGADDKEWIINIMEAMDYFDEYLDSGDEFNFLERMQTVYKSIAESAIPNISKDFHYHANIIRSRLAILPKERKEKFLRNLRLLFRAILHSRKAQTLEEYFRYIIIEGRLSGSLVADGLRDLSAGKFLRNFGSAGILFDQLQDFREDKQAGRHNFPGIEYYKFGVKYFVSELLNGEMWVLKFLQSKQSLPLWKAGFMRFGEYFH